jgi:Stress responsive A/B Barrel Domain
MFSHVVIFWTKPENPNAADELIAGANKYLQPIPGVIQFHIGRMVKSPRPVVDQSYQVALNLIFPDKKTQDDYQVHPLHIEFVDKVFKPNCARVVIYDFEG